MVVAGGGRATRTCSAPAEPRWIKAGADTSVQIPCRGTGADRPRGRGPFNLPGVGSSQAATLATGADQHRASEQDSEHEKLNHERPEPSWRQGLAGEFDRRRCRIGKACRRWVERSFWFLPLESVLYQEHGDYAGAGASDVRRQDRRVTPATDVIGRAKTTANAGTSAGTGIGPRCPGGDAWVIQLPQRGSVA